MKKIYKLTVEPITAVHIGSGNELTPLDYMVCMSRNIPKYIKFSSDSILKKILTDNKKASEFDRISQIGDMKSIQKFFHKYCDNDDVEYTSPVTSEFNSVYEANSNKDPLENAAIVQEMFKDAGSPNPVIPGSSLKGAVRTGILNGIINKLSPSEKSEILKERNDSAIEKKLLGSYKDAKSDPFRAVEFSDLIFESIGSKLVGMMKNISCDEKTGKIIAIDKLQMQAEVIKGSLMDSFKPANSSLQINTDLQCKNGLSKSISIDDIIENCNKFYLDEFNEEYEKFYSYEQGENDPTKLIDKLRTELEKVKNAPKQFIIRVGRWSQVEFVTFAEPFRKPKTPRQNGKFMPFGTTRTVFNYDGQYLPMGWCKCTVEEIKN